LPNPAIRRADFHAFLKSQSKRRRDETRRCNLAGHLDSENLMGDVFCMDGTSRSTEFIQRKENDIFVDYVVWQFFHSLT
jgi:hypothetical protein